MAEKKHKKHDEEPEVVSPEEADRIGKINIIRGFLQDEEIREIIKTTFLTESLPTTIIMACFLVGIFKLWEVAKNIIKFGWEIDFIISIFLILVGLKYIIPLMLNRRERWSTKGK